MVIPMVESQSKKVLKRAKREGKVIAAERPYVAFKARAYTRPLFGSTQAHMWDWGAIRRCFGVVWEVSGGY